MNCLTYTSKCPIQRDMVLWGHSTWYDEQCGDCKKIVQIGKRKFCGLCSARVTIHDVVRAQIGCTWCENYTKKLDSSVCLKCLEEHKNAEPFCMSKIRGLDPYAKKV
nr:MAG TPA: hypothetical protein [Caudoviricetes sp.]